MNWKAKPINRSGVYLVDLLVTMTVIVMLLSMCTVWAGKTMQFTSRVRGRADHARAIERAREVRHLIRYGNSISLQGQTLTVKRAGGDVTIEISVNELRIVDQSGEKEKRETIRFAEEAVLQWNADELPQWITLGVSRKFKNKFRGESKETAQTDLRLRMAPAMKLVREGLK